MLNNLNKGNEEEEVTEEEYKVKLADYFLSRNKTKSILLKRAPTLFENKERKSGHNVFPIL